MIKVTKKLSIFTVLVLTICLLVGSVIAFAADNKVYTIRLGHGLPATHYIAIQYANWAKMIKEESNGRLNVKIYPGGQLYTDTNLISAVKTGACEMGAVYSFNLTSIIPEFNIFVIPGVFNGRDTFLKAIEGYVGEKLFEKTEEKGIKALGWIVWAIGGEDQGVISKKPIHVPSDMKGMTVRSMGSQQAQYFEEYCGASSGYVPGAELYMALQRGTLDASSATLSHLIDRKLSEVAPYFCKIPQASYPTVLIMNKGFYDKLPEDLQQVIDDVTAKIQKKSYSEWAYVYQVYTLKTKEAVAGRGEIYIPTPEEYALWVKDIEGFWKRTTTKTPEVYDLIMQVQNINKK